ncbi:hypothetical protein LINPERPRIM_LOCUS20842, partial [Linum perenne]
FLLTIGHNAKNRTCQVLFYRSGETVSRTIRCVLATILNLHTMMLAKFSASINQGCLRALDGTSISVRTTTASQARYRTRKGYTGVNCLGVVNLSLQFIYSLAGWEGSAHDSRVLRDALSRPDGLRVPQGESNIIILPLIVFLRSYLYCISSVYIFSGNYYLVDVGYMNANSFLAPYQGQRYHLQEWGANRPTTTEEYYNMKHSKARNVVECAFGVLKMRWAMLRDTSWYNPRMVGLFFTVGCVRASLCTTKHCRDTVHGVYGR